MFHNIEQYPFLRHILDNSEEIIREFELRSEHSLLENFLHHPMADIHSHTDYWIREGGFAEEQIGYDAREGSWASFPLYKKGFPIKWYDAERTFPTITSLLQTVPGLNFSAFFRIASQSGSKEHVHAQQNLIFHLCLTDPEGESVIRCAGEERTLSKKGDHLLFDYSKPHSSFNYGKKDRINLVIDFSIPDQSFFR